MHVFDARYEVWEQGLANPRGQKVIYIVIHPLSKRDVKRFGLAEFLGAGLQVGVWDLSHLYGPVADTHATEAPSWVDLTICSNISHLSSMCSSLTSEDVVIIIGGLNPGQVWESHKILHLLSATPAWLTSVSLGHIPNPILPGRIRSLTGNRFAWAFSRLVNPGRMQKAPQRLFSTVLGWALTSQRRMRLGGSNRPLDHIWVGTMVSGIASCYVASTTTITYIHTLDYDLVLALRSGGSQSTARLVFVDSMGPLHPEYLVHGSDSGVSIDVYSDLVCRALDEIEKRLGAEVVVAVHPRANFGVLEPWYGGRRLIYGQTPELVSGATVVIVAEGSAAIGMAAFFRKPLVLLASRKADSFIQGMNGAFAQALDTPLIDLDALELPPFTLDVNEDAYAEFVENYIKRRGTPEEPFWSVVASEIVSGTQPPGKNAVE